MVAGHAPLIATRGRFDPPVSPLPIICGRPFHRLWRSTSALRTIHWPWRRSVSRRRATIRSHPLADPLLPSGGSIRPASYGRLSFARGTICFCSARRTAPPLALFALAQPILSAMFGSQCAALAIRSLPLARSLAPASLAPLWALSPRPKAPPVPHPKSNRAEADSAAGPALAGPTPATSFDGRTA